MKASDFMEDFLNKIKIFLFNIWNVLKKKYKQFKNKEENNKTTKIFCLLFDRVSFTDTYNSAFVAGITLGCAGFLYLSVFNMALTVPLLAPILKIIAAFLFSYGLLDIIQNKRYLYTGCIGKAYLCNYSEWLHLFFCLIANVLALTTVGFLTPWLCPNLINIANGIIITKLSYSWLEVLLKSIGCGVFMYLAVNAKNNMMITLSVAGFILCGFEHCLADWFYFCVSNTFSFSMISFFIIAIIGNTIGANIIRLIKGEIGF